MTDIDSAPPLAAFQGSVTCQRAGAALMLTGAAADSADDILTLTLIAPTVAELPERLTAATVRALGGDRFCITCGSRDWIVAAVSAHVHRDVGRVFFRAVPPRPAPLAKLLLWRLALALAGSRAGKRLLLSLRRRT